MFKRLRKRLRWLAIGLLLLTLLFVGGDEFRLNPAQQTASPYTYDLVQWEAANFLSKWIHRLTRSLPWNRLSKEEQRQRVTGYFQMNEEARTLQHALTQAIAQAGSGGSVEVTDLESQLERLKAIRNELRNDVEETIEATISSVLADDGLSTLGEFIFPPVDVRLGEPPRLLVTSPRDRIERTHDVLIKPDVKVEERQRVEEELLTESDLAALVINIGGVATYPASIPGSQSLRWTLQISAHEWLHHYFFFRPLGQNMFDSAEMQTLNETIAGLVGREIGDRAFLMLGGTIEVSPPAPLKESMPTEDDQEGVDRFDFDEEMRLTRLRVDEMLGEGRIEEAEAYMEQRRNIFVENGFFIRKLNQAFFAFNGTYAESPASVSPIGDQLHEFRALVPDLGTFVDRVAGISSYQEFLDNLERLK